MKRKQHPWQGDDASRAEATTVRVERDEQGEARPSNTAPKGGPHLELERSSLKTRSETGFSIADGIGLSLGRRLVNLLPVAQRTNPITNGIIDRPWVIGRQFKSHVHRQNAF